jgi:hypothetical protein
MSRELFSYDATTGMSVYFDYNELTDEVTLEYEQDVQPLLDANKVQANEPEFTRQGIKQEMWKYASIPVGLQMKWLVEEGLDVYDDNAWPQIFRKLNDPAYAYLKTTHKHHSKATFKGIITP